MTPGAGLPLPGPGNADEGKGQETPSLTIDEAKARLPQGVVSVLAERLRGNFREVRRYRPQITPSRTAPETVDDSLEMLESESEMDPESD